MAIPSVSIIVPVYNIERYLDQCLSSLCNQTLKDIEIVCVDDGSTDNSPEILDAWAAKDSRVVAIHKPNGGVSSARNVGIANATGEFIGFVDGDDYIDSNACETLVDVLKREKADIVVFGGQVFPEVAWVSECLDTRDVVKHEDGRLSLFYERGCIPFTWNKLYRRVLFLENDLRFNEDLALGEDISLQFFAFPLSRCTAFITESFYHYRFEREGSAVTIEFKDHLKQLSTHVDVFEYISAGWMNKGYLANHESRLLDCISFIFFDYAKLTPQELFIFSRKFAAVFEKYYSDSVLKDTQDQNRLLYLLLLEVSRCKGSDRQISIILKKYRLLSNAHKLNERRKRIPSRAKRLLTRNNSID